MAQRTESSNAMAAKANSLNGQFKGAAQGVAEEVENYADAGLKDLKAIADGLVESVSDIGADVKKSKVALQKRVSRSAKRAAEFARENPLPLVIGAVGIGLIAGLFITRRRS